MKFNIALLKEVLPEAVTVGCCDNEEFTFLDVARPTGSLSEKVDKKAVLFFPVYALNVKDEGWYNKDFDRRTILADIARDNPDWVFVVDQTCPEINGKRVYVLDIFSAIEKLFRYALDLVRPMIVAVTGSVGKTTTVAMLEDAIVPQAKCLRVFSKRITPLVLWSSVINFLEDDTDFVVLEMSFYREHHIEWLAKAVPPDVSVLLNIGMNHVGVEGVSIEDIVYAKSKIITPNSIPVVNVDDSYLAGLASRLDDGAPLTPFGGRTVTCSLCDNTCDVYGHILAGCLQIHLDGKVYTPKLFLQTRLAAQQVSAVFAVCSIYGLDMQRVEAAVGDFVPKEHRVSKKLIDGHEVIFDGDVTHPSRLLKLADNFYPHSTLIVEQFDFGADPIEPKIPGMVELFQRFDAVRISDDIKFPEKIITVLWKRYPQCFQPKETLMNNLSDDTQIFYHCGGYFMRGVVC